MNELLPQDRLTSAPSTPRRPALHPVWRRVGKIVLRLLALLLLVLVVILGGAAAYGWLRYNQQVVLPQPTGKYAVGRAGFDWIDQNREESFSSDPAAKRELMVWVWYPVEAGSQGNLVQYLPDPWRIALERSRGFLAYFLTQNLAQVRPHALANVPLAAGQPSYPVLVMQPGLGPIATDYTTIAEELASHGYIVVASTPTYSSSMVVFADGREVDGSRAANVADNATPAEARSTLDHLVMIWAADNRFVLDQLTALNQGQLNQAQAGEEGQRFAGRLDLSRVGLFGHSFGGASAAQTCSLDARCSAGADLDGYLYGDVVQQGLRQPFLFLWSDDPNTQEAANDIATFSQHSTNTIDQATIHGMHHFNFTDTPLMYSPILSLMKLLGPIDGRRGLQITSAYLVAFFDHTLQGVDSPLLSGPSSAYPEVEFHSR